MMNSPIWTYLQIMKELVLVVNIRDVDSGDNIVNGKYHAATDTVIIVPSPFPPHMLLKFQS